MEGVPTQISDDELLLRRIYPGWMVPKDGTLRLSSQAFLPDESGEVSVHRISLTTLEEVWRRAQSPAYGVVAILASLPRSKGYGIKPDPEPGDVSHAVLIPPDDHGKKKQIKAAREFGEACHWLIPVDRSRTEFVL